MPRTTSTIYEVARRAGVSIATVSRVQRGHGAVTPATRQRVRAVIEELGYRPSAPARALAGLRHDACAVVFPDLSGPYYSEVILGFEERASAAGHSVLILATHGRARAAEQVVDLAGRVDGLVVMGQAIDDSLVTALHDGGVPIVLLARPPAAGADTVRAENVNAAEVLAAHLLDHGYRRFAFVGDPDASTDVWERWRGLESTLRNAGIAEFRTARSGFRERDGQEAAGRLLADERPPDVLLAANDEIAIGAYRAALALGLRVPEDVAITGWDDITLAEHVGPGITTVRQPSRELGATAASLLLDRIGGDRAEPHHVLLQTEVVIRTSCGSHPE